MTVPCLDSNLKDQRSPYVQSTAVPLKLGKGTCDVGTRDSLGAHVHLSSNGDVAPLGQREPSGRLWGGQEVVRRDQKGGCRA